MDDQYRKWDNFGDEDVLGDDVVPTRFDTGEGDMAPLDMCYVEPSHACARLPKHEQEIWQVLVRKLRVWSASSVGADSGDDAIPCRPHCIFVNNLYPKGRALTRELVVPRPEAPPEPEAILELTLRLMAEPPDERTPQHRPGRVVFADVRYANALSLSYRALGIECTQLSESDGVDDHVAEFSSFLVRKDLAARSSVSEKPGLLATRGVTPALCASVFDAAATCAASAPWDLLSERQAIRMVFPAAAVAHGAVLPAADELWVTVLGKGGQGPRGLGVFHYRYDLEQRVLPPGEVLARLELARPACSHTGATEVQVRERSGGKRGLKKTKPRMFDERTGLELMYADADAQRAHWKGVRRHAKPLEQRRTRVPDDPAAPPHWAAEEFSLLFEDQTCLPFDDHDAIDAHGWRVGPARDLYPLPLLYRMGEPSRPDPAQLLAIERALRGTAALIESGGGNGRLPDVMRISSSTVQMDNTADPLPPTELRIRTCGGDSAGEMVLISNATVLTLAEWEGATGRKAVGAHGAEAAGGVATEAGKEAAPPGSGQGRAPKPNVLSATAGTADAAPAPAAPTAHNGALPKCAAASARSPAGPPNAWQGGGHKNGCAVS
jgi:hypothetical protein